MDREYDVERGYAECEDRDSQPIIPLRETPAVKAGKAKPADLPTWGVAVRRVRSQARRREVALPNRRMCPS